MYFTRIEKYNPHTDFSFFIFAADISVYYGNGKKKIRDEVSLWTEKKEENSSVNCTHHRRHNVQANYMQLTLNTYNFSSSFYTISSFQPFNRTGIFFFSFFLFLFEGLHVRICATQNYTNLNGTSTNIAVNERITGNLKNKSVEKRNERETKIKIHKNQANERKHDKQKGMKQKKKKKTRREIYIFFFLVSCKNDENQNDIAQEHKWKENRLIINKTVYKTRHIKNKICCTHTTWTWLVAFNSASKIIFKKIYSTRASSDSFGFAKKNK